MQKYKYQNYGYVSPPRFGYLDNLTLKYPQRKFSCVRSGNLVGHSRSMPYSSFGKYSDSNILEHKVHNEDLHQPAIIRYSENEAARCVHSRNISKAFEGHGKG